MVLPKEVPRRPGDRPPRKPGRPPGAVRGVTREAVLDAAERVFATTGFHGGSIADIAHLAGLSTAGLLHYFPSKRTLYSAVLERRDSVDRRDVNPAPDAAPGFDSLVSWLVALVHRNQSQPGMVRLFTVTSGGAVDPGHPAHGWLGSHYAETSAQCREHLERGVAAGSIRPDAPLDHIVYAIIATLDGLQVRWVHGEGDFDMLPPLLTVLDALARVWRVQPGAA
jgi:AcrR family transcriptional regulator